MEKRAIQPPDTATPAAPYTPVIVSGDLVVTAGQVAFDQDGKVVEGGIREQTRQALENVKRCLAAAGAGLEDVIKVNAFLADLGDFQAYNEVYAEFFQPPYPVRTTVQAGLPAGLLLEVEATARAPR